MRIVKNNHLGEQVWDYEGELIEQTESALLIKARFNREDLRFNGVLLREGDVFLELYPFEKWFNVYEIHDKESGLIKAWYCNVTRPAKINKDAIFYDDLALDLFAYPDGTYVILDEDEFEELNLSEEDIINARNGLQELIAIFSSMQFTMLDYQRFI